MKEQIELDGVLGEATDFVHAIWLAAGGLDDRQVTNVFQALADQISDRIRKAREMAAGSQEVSHDAN